MTFRLSSFRPFFSMVLVLMLALPCSLKAEVKESLGIEFTPGSRANKQTCTAFTVTDKQNSQKPSAGTQPYPLAESAGIEQFSGHNAQAEFFRAQKEKIPSYLLFCNFRI